jgi:hypothetical protein
MFLGYKYGLRFVVIELGFFHIYLDRSCRKYFNQNNCFYQGITLLFYFCLFCRFLFLLNKHHFMKKLKNKYPKMLKINPKIFPNSRRRSPSSQRSGMMSMKRRNLQKRRRHNRERERKASVAQI